MKKKIISISAGLTGLIIIILAVVFGKKILQAKRIKIGDIDIVFPKFRLINLLSSVNFEVNVTIQNFANIDYKLEQISLDVLTLKNNLIAGQTNPLNNSVILSASKNTIITVNYSLSYTNLIQLIKDNELNKNTNASTILNKIIQENKIGTQIILKGYVVAEGVKINIEEKINV